MATADPMPEFTIKAKDALAVPTIRAYLRECEDHGLHFQAKEVEKALSEITHWQARNVELTKLPDHRHVGAADREANDGDK